MLTTSKFLSTLELKGDEGNEFYVLPRSEGGYDKIILPKKYVGSTKLDLDIVNKQITFNVDVHSDDVVYVLADKFGVISGNTNHVEVNFIHFDGGSVLFLVEGKLLVETDEGVIQVNQYGEVSEPAPTTLTKAKWVTSDDIKFYHKTSIGITYRPQQKDLDMYLYNLTVSCMLSNIPPKNLKDGGYIFSCRCLTFNDSIANGKPIINYTELLEDEPDENSTQLFTDEFDDDDVEDEDEDDYDDYEDEDDMMEVEDDGEVENDSSGEPVSGFYA